MRVMVTLNLDGIYSQKLAGILYFYYPAQNMRSLRTFWI